MTMMILFDSLFDKLELDRILVAFDAEQVDFAFKFCVVNSVSRFKVRLLVGCCLLPVGCCLLYIAS